jgi:hypothetical protein
LFTKLLPKLNPRVVNKSEVERLACLRPLSVSGRQDKVLDARLWRFEVCGSEHLLCTTTQDEADEQRADEPSHR